MAEKSTEEDATQNSTTTIEASAEESEKTTRPSEHLQQRRQRCVYRPREFTTTMAASAEEDGPKDSVKKQRHRWRMRNRRHIQVIGDNDGVGEYSWDNDGGCGIVMKGLRNWKQ